MRIDDIKETAQESEQKLAMRMESTEDRERTSTHNKTVQKEPRTLHTRTCQACKFGMNKIGINMSWHTCQTRETTNEQHLKDTPITITITIVGPERRILEVPVDISKATIVADLKYKIEQMTGIEAQHQTICTTTVHDCTIEDAYSRK